MSAAFPHGANRHANRGAADQRGPRWRTDRSRRGRRRQILEPSGEPNTRSYLKPGRTFPKQF
jgi:hypothetical protein